MNGMDEIYLSIVIPVYNEEENVRVIHEKLHEECQKINKTYELIFVDDGSCDDTIRMLCEIQTKDSLVRIIKLSRNHGHQIALSAGLDHAEADYTITMDADLQHPPEMIPKFLEAAEKGYEIVTGVKDRTEKRGLIKNVIATCYYAVFKRISEIKVEPNASDFRLYSRKALNVIKKMREKERYLRGIAEWIGFSQFKIHYTAPERHAGTPKYTISKLAKLASLGMFSFSAVPIRISTYIGVIIILINIVHIIFTFIVWLRNPEQVPGYTTLVIVMSFLFSWLFIAVGILGEYVYRIYEEVKDRPLYIIDWKK